MGGKNAAGACSNQLVVGTRGPFSRIAF